MLHLIKRLDNKIATFKCDCGQLVDKNYRNVFFKQRPSHCGCKTSEIKEKVNQINRIRLQKYFPKHARMLKTWHGMKQRCYNKKCPAYKWYGAKGIKINQDWHDFKNFEKDMEATYCDSLTIDRIDPRGDYSKENCRWATYETQANNKKDCKKAPVFVEYKGESKSLSQWARYFGVSHQAISQRYKKYNSVDPNQLRKYTSAITINNNR